MYPSMKLGDGRNLSSLSGLSNFLTGRAEQLSYQAYPYDRLGFDSGKTTGAYSAGWYSQANQIENQWQKDIPLSQFPYGISLYDRPRNDNKERPRLEHSTSFRNFVLPQTHLSSSTRHQSGTSWQIPGPYQANIYDQRLKPTRSATPHQLSGSVIKPQPLLPKKENHQLHYSCLQITKPVMNDDYVYNAGKNLILGRTDGYGLNFKSQDASHLHYDNDNHSRWLYEMNPSQRDIKRQAPRGRSCQISRKEPPCSNYEEDVFQPPKLKQKQVEDTANPLVSSQIVNNSSIPIMKSANTSQLHQIKVKNLYENSVDVDTKRQLVNSTISVNQHIHQLSSQSVNDHATLQTTLASLSDKNWIIPQNVKENFIQKYVIGRGGFGKVWAVEEIKTKNSYAMKEISKALVIMKKSVSSVMNERMLLEHLASPYIVNMVSAFQDRNNLFLVMDLMQGGDLRYHLGKHRRFNQEQSRFFFACILQGLAYLHMNRIIHRDIKPENLVFDSKGYLKITDLGIARAIRADNQNETSGTLGYMAPEVLCRQQHNMSVDLYALGIILHECMLGRRPYNGKTRKDLRDQVLSHRVHIRWTDVPSGWDVSAADLINRLLERKPEKRIGSSGLSEIRCHSWLFNFPWADLDAAQLTAPFIPTNVSYEDAKQQLDPLMPDAINLAQQALNQDQQTLDKLFFGYDYVKKSVNGDINGVNVNILKESNPTQNIEPNTQQKWFSASDLSSIKKTYSTTSPLDQLMTTAKPVIVQQGGSNLFTVTKPLNSNNGNLSFTYQKSDNDDYKSPMFGSTAESVKENIFEANRILSYDNLPPYKENSVRSLSNGRTGFPNEKSADISVFNAENTIKF